MDIASALRAAVPELSLAGEPDVLEAYRFDRAQLVEAGTPAVAAFPDSTEQVRAIAAFAHADGIAIVPRGAGSGLSGGANAIDGCIVVCLNKMNAILEVDEANLLAVVQPGVINADLKAHVREMGLWYAPDPASAGFSTIGGNIATNAGGLCCVKYGVTADAVLGLEVVLADGGVIRTGRRTRKGVAGLDLTRLFVGSEGTLGIVTEATVRLRPAPQEQAILVASFPSLATAGTAITAIVSSLMPSLLELIDATTLRAIEEWKPVGLDAGAQALLIAGADDADAEQVLAAIEDRCLDAEATLVVRSSTAGEADLLLEARRLAFPALERLGNVMLDDVAVPPSRITDLLARVEQIAVDHDLLIGTFGHAGDGNLHPTIVFDANDEAVTARARRAFEEIVRSALEFGGTITGEHGVGTLKQRFLEAEIGSTAMAVQRAVKAALDPRGILNPGKAI